MNLFRFKSCRFFCLVAFLFSSVVDIRSQDIPIHFMPLTPGTYWVYKGTVRWYDFERRKPTTKPVSIKMTVERVIHEPDFTAAILSGSPWDLDWSEGEWSPQHTLLIETRSHQVFLEVLESDVDPTRLESDSTSFQKYMTEDNLIFQWPLKKGQKFCDAESKQRPDDRYCWVIATQSQKNLEAVKGIRAQSRRVFLLQYDTNPEDTQMELSPGIGIVSYQYHHHGSIADTRMSLVEFHLAASASAKNGAKQ